MQFVRTERTSTLSKEGCVHPRILPTEEVTVLCEFSTFFAGFDTRMGVVVNHHGHLYRCFDEFFT